MKKLLVGVVVVFAIAVFGVPWYYVIHNALQYLTAVNQVKVTK
jgi:hypothetical protein